MSQILNSIRQQCSNIKLTREQMHEYQRTALQFLKDHPFSALWISMGLGKSITALTLACDLLNEYLTKKVLIVGPLKVATDTWPTEIGLWEHTASQRFTVIRADDNDPRIKEARKRARDFARSEGLGPDDVSKMATRAATAEAHRIRAELAMSKSSIHIINREALEWLVNFHREKWPYDTVIIDESSGFKDHASDRFKCLAKVRRSGNLIKRLHELTATPATEGLQGLWSQMYLLDLGKRLGKNITAFRKTYQSYNRWSRLFEMRPDAEETILAKISDIVLVMKAEDYLDLEKPLIVERPVILADEQIALYEQMKADKVVQLPNGEVVEAEQAAALSAKLLQMASGVLYDTKLLEDWDTGDFKKVTKIHHLHDHKIDTLKEIMEGMQGNPVLVSYHFKSSLKRLKEAFPKAVVMDKEGKCIKKWNAGKIPMLLVHPQSAGHGLNLQKGGHNIVMFDLIWSLELYLQLIGRLARQGQTHPVVVQLLTAVGTLDQVVAAALNMKGMTQERMFKILKKMIAELWAQQQVRALVKSAKEVMANSPLRSPRLEALVEENDEI